MIIVAITQDEVGLFFPNLILRVYMAVITCPYQMDRPSNVSLKKFFIFHTNLMKIGEVVVICVN